MRILRTWDEDLLAACREPTRRAKTIARCERHRTVSVILAIAGLVAASGSMFGSIADPRSITAGYLALAFMIAAQQATSTIRLLRMSEWVWRSS